MSKTVATLHRLVLSKVLSKGMAKKILFPGLKFENFRLAYARNETEGLTGMLSEKSWKIFRVTKSKRFLKNPLSEYFKKRVN